MRTRLWKEIVLSVLVILALIVPIPALAVDQPASSQATAGAPLSDWVSIEPGASHWYQFRYNFDNSRANIKDRVEDDSDKNRENSNRWRHDPEPAVVILKAADDTRTVNFAVQTPATLALPKYDKDGKVNGPLGVGSPLSDAHGDVASWSTFVWSGGTIADETFYVIVKNNSTSTKSYHLSITGPDVSF